MRLDPQQIKLQISNLILQHPELQDDEILRADMIEGATDTFDALKMIVHRIQDTDALGEGTAARIEELTARKDRFAKRRDALRAVAFTIMTAADLKKAELPDATLSIRNGTAKVVIHDEAALPPDCMKAVVSPDRTAIKNKISAGEEVPGAHLSNAEPTLAIRVK